MRYKILARKYRPQTFEEVIGQKHVVQTLKNAIKGNRIGQAYMFSGMRGVGKTTAARILAKALNCLSSTSPTPTPCNKCEPCLEVNEDRAVDVLEIDGAANRRVEETRTLREGLKYKPIRNRYKVVIIDEVHMLTNEAFNTLLKILEEPPTHTIFVFATTEFHKVPATIVSRCQHFEFRKISQKEIINHLLEICRKEGITVSSHGLHLIAQAADGSLRDAQSLLDQAVAFSGENVSDEDLKQILGTISRNLLFQTSSAIIEGKADRVFYLIEQVVESGHDLIFFYKELIQHFRNLLLTKTVTNLEGLLLLNEEDMKLFKTEAEKVSQEDILRYLHSLQKEEAGLKYSSHPRIFLETLLVKLCYFQRITPLEKVLKKLSEWPSGIPDTMINNRDIPQSGEEKATIPAKKTALKEAAVEKNIPLASVGRESQDDSPEKKTRNPLTVYSKNKETESALKEPGVRYFIDTFRAQILAVDSVKTGNGKEEE